MSKENQAQLYGRQTRRVKFPKILKTEAVREVDFESRLFMVCNFHFTYRFTTHGESNRALDNASV